jgi:hypothetical protein
VALPQLLDQVLGQVTDALPGVLGARQETLRVELQAEPDDMPRLISGADRVERLVPAGQQLPAGRVEEAAGCLVPDGQVIAIEAHHVGGRPPDLVVGRCEHLAEVGAGDGAADREVDLRSCLSLASASERRRLASRWR